MINIYHNDNEISKTSKFMEDLFKKHQNIRFTGAGDSYQNGSEEHTINMVIDV